MKWDVFSKRLGAAPTGAGSTAARGAPARAGIPVRGTQAAQGPPTIGRGRRSTGARCGSGQTDSDSVWNLQLALMSKHLPFDDGPTGFYGSAHATACAAFQQQAGLDGRRRQRHRRTADHQAPRSRVGERLSRQTRLVVPSSRAPAKYLSSTFRKTGTSGSASANKVIDDCSFWASIRAEDLDGVCLGQLGQHLRALLQSRSQDGVREVGHGFGQARDGKVLRRRAPAEAGDLGKTNHIQWPRLYPARSSPSALCVGVAGILRVDEALQVIHGAMVSRAGQGD